MIQTLQAKDLSLAEIQTYFGLEQTSERNFFPEWQENLPKITEAEKQILNRVQRNYFNLVNSGSGSEEVVKMVVLSFLLDLAEFYQAPFSIKTETSIEIQAEDEGVIVRGKIDVLVIKQQFWVLVIECKSTKIDVMEALPQALVYMLNSPNTEKPIFGFLVNGREFVFVKVIQGKIPQYSRSYALSIERENELEQVLSVLKNIGQIMINQKI